MWSADRIEEAEALAAVLAEAPAAPEGTFRVRLAFGAEVDLDLFVSDPLEESVYFANDRAASGGELIGDRRCEHPAPRVETIEWSAPPTGRYRIGVDFPRRCGDGTARTAVFALAVEHGASRTLHRGLIDVGVFLPVVARQDLR